MLKFGPHPTLIDHQAACTAMTTSTRAIPFLSFVVYRAHESNRQQGKGSSRSIPTGLSFLHDLTTCRTPKATYMATLVLVDATILKAGTLSGIVPRGLTMLFIVVVVDGDVVLWLWGL
jgi:hypothetical protein